MIGSVVHYDAGEGVDTWEVMDVRDGYVFLRNLYGATTCVTIDELM